MAYDPDDDAMLDAAAPAPQADRLIDTPDGHLHWRDPVDPGAAPASRGGSIYELKNLPGTKSHCHGAEIKTSTDTDGPANSASVFNCSVCGQPTHNVAAPAEIAAQPKWIRQESCPECDGDGCAYCDPEIGETAGEMTAEQRQYNELEARYFSDKLMDAAEIGELRAKVSDLERERDTLGAMKNQIEHFAEKQRKQIAAAELKLKAMREALRLAQLELSNIYRAIPLAVLREWIPGWPNSVTGA